MKRKDQDASEKSASGVAHEPEVQNDTQGRFLTTRLFRTF